MSLFFGKHVRETSTHKESGSDPTSSEVPCKGQRLQCFGTKSVFSRVLVGASDSSASSMPSWDSGLNPEGILKIC